MNWYDEPNIFFDGTTDEDITIGETQLRGIVSDSQEIARGGSVVSPVVGSHSSILVRKSDLSESPAIKSEIVAASGTYTVQNVLDSGSCWKIMATRNQRRGR